MLLSILSTILFSLTPQGDTAFFPAPDPNTVINKTELLRLVNGIRTKGCNCGDTWYGPVAPLTWNDQLEAAAQAHSNDMQARKYFAHNSPEGHNAGYRIDKAGYNWAAFGENIGMGYRDEAEVIMAWKSSPAHCKNIMNGKYTEMGVARAGSYWTQAFGKPHPRPLSSGAGEGRNNSKRPNRYKYIFEP